MRTPNTTMDNRKMGTQPPRELGDVAKALDKTPDYYIKYIVFPYRPEAGHSGEAPRIDPAYAEQPIYGSIDDAYDFALGLARNGQALAQDIVIYANTYTRVAVTLEHSSTAKMAA